MQVPSVQQSLSPNFWSAAPFLAALAVGMAAFFRIYTFKCPFCGLSFHREQGRGGLFSSKCRHCGLAMWADPPGRLPEP